MTDNHGNISIKGIIIILSLFLFSAALIGIGAYYSYSSSPKKVLKQTLTTVSNNINNLVSRDEKYRLDNTFSLESDIKTITWYDVTDPDMLEHKDFLNNYLNFESKIKIIQNEEKEKAYFHIHAKENNLDYMDLKYLIKESTGYYYNNYITNKYINMGTNNYFETISKDTNTRSNIEYLNTYIIDSLTNNISDKYMETSQEKVSLNNGDFNSDKISIELDNQKINDLFKLVLKDLKKDDKSSKILGNYFDGFNDYKLKNKKYLKKKEKLTINIYTTQLTGKLLKIEVIDQLDTKVHKYVYEVLNDPLSELYVIEDEKVKNIYEITKESDNKYNINVIDNKGKEIGTILFNKTDKETILDVSINSNLERLDIDYKASYKDIKKDSYTEDIGLEVKYLKKNKNMLTINATVNNKATKEGKIAEDTSESILENTLTEEQKIKKDNFYDNKIRKLIGDTNEKNKQ